MGWYVSQFIHHISLELDGYVLSGERGRGGCGLHQAIPLFHRLSFVVVVVVNLRGIVRQVWGVKEVEVVERRCFRLVYRLEP